MSKRVSVWRIVANPPVQVGMMIVAMLVVAGLIDQKHDRIGGEQTTHKELTNVQRVPPVATGWMFSHSTIKPPNREPNPDRKEWREEQNLDAQRQTAKWTKWATFAAWVAAIVTAGGVVLVGRTLTATREMLIEAKKTTREAQKANITAEQSGATQLDSFRRLERPYLFIEIVSTRFLGSSKLSVYDPSLEYTIVNFGKLPAVMRSASVGLSDDAEAETPTTGAIADRMYHVIAAGGSLPFPRMVAVCRNGERVEGVWYDGQAATNLVLVAHLEYSDPTGAIHEDWFRMRGAVNATGFTLESTKRSTYYP